jgi:hypothetical protein
MATRISVPRRLRKGRGLQGRRRGFGMGPIMVPDLTLKRQKDRKSALRANKPWLNVDYRPSRSLTASHCFVTNREVT